MSDHEVDQSKRTLLVATTSSMGALGVAAAAVPFAASMQPSAKTTAAGAPVEVDLNNIGEGELRVVEWRRKPVWILRRTQEEVESLEAVEDRLRDPASQESEQPDYVDLEYRSIKPEWLVLVGICTHLGCSPTYRPDKAPADLGQDWIGGFLCPCHGGRYDLAGRVYKGVPPPLNLPVPPHRFTDEGRLIIGEDPEVA